MDLQASPGRRGVCLPHGVFRLAADSGRRTAGKSGRTWWEARWPGRRQQRLFRHKEVQPAFLGDEGPSRQWHVQEDGARPGGSGSGAWAHPREPAG